MKVHILPIMSKQRISYSDLGF